MSACSCQPVIGLAAQFDGPQPCCEHPVTSLSVQSATSPAIARLHPPKAAWMAHNLPLSQQNRPIAGKDCLRRLSCHIRTSPSAHLLKPRHPQPPSLLFLFNDPSLFASSSAATVRWPPVFLSYRHSSFCTTTCTRPTMSSSSLPVTGSSPPHLHSDHESTMTSALGALSLEDVAAFLHSDSPEPPHPRPAFGGGASAANSPSIENAQFSTDSGVTRYVKLELKSADALRARNVSDFATWVKVSWLTSPQMFLYFTLFHLTYLTSLHVFFSSLQLFRFLLVLSTEFSSV